MTLSQNELLRKIPSVEVLLEAAEARWPPAEVPRRVIVAAVRAAVAAARELLQTAAAPPADAEALRELILTDVGRRIKATLGPHYRKAINATGIILHTGLGRAVLPAQALRQIVEELSGYSVLQIDVAGGQRPDGTSGSRSSSGCSPAPRPPPWSTTTPPPRRSCSTPWPPARK